MKILINLLLICLCAVIGYFIYDSIKEPIEFEAQLSKRQGAVVTQLKKIRTAQEIYKQITGNYANSMDSLKYVLENKNIETYKIIGNLDDENTETKIETLYTKASDSIRNLGISLDSLHYVPFGTANAAFNVKADTLTYQNTLVNVVEVGIKKSEYMGKYADKKYMRYNPFYNPDDMLKFGDMNSPNTSGNWR